MSATLKLFRRFLCSAPRSSHLHARWSKKAVTDLVPATVLSRHDAIALRFDFDCVNRLVQFWIELSADRLNWLNTSRSKRVNVYFFFGSNSPRSCQPSPWSQAALVFVQTSKPVTG